MFPNLSVEFNQLNEWWTLEDYYEKYYYCGKEEYETEINKNREHSKWANQCIYQCSICKKKSACNRHLHTHVQKIHSKPAKSIVKMLKCVKMECEFKEYADNI